VGDWPIKEYLKKHFANCQIDKTLPASSPSEYFRQNFAKLITTFFIITYTQDKAHKVF